MSYSAGPILDAMVAVCLNTDVSAEYDLEASPNPEAAIAAHPLFWRRYYEYIVHWNLPPGYIVLCGIALPNYSGRKYVPESKWGRLGFRSGMP